MVLTHKEKEVVVKRFSLNNQPRQTLESIGQHFSVTRERIRQIEKIALTKLRRTVSSTKLQEINNLAKTLLTEQGGVMLETRVITDILKRIYSSSDVDVHIIRLAVTIDSDMTRLDKDNAYFPFWKLRTVRMQDIETVLNTSIDFLTKKGDVIKQDRLISDLEQSLTNADLSFPKNFITAVLELDMRLKLVDGCYGLSTWRHVNPRSIRDKAYVVLRKSKKPLHFIEIANRIAETGFDRKVVTTQAVHNELIRYEQFVLVGRGLYALKEWGYQEGTVSDVIRILLKGKSPMTKQEIIEGVLKQRQVKKGTISLNLQKNPKFVRVGRAVYAYKEEKK